jgi:hypothetical protein
MGNRIRDTPVALLPTYWMTSARQNVNCRITKILCRIGGQHRMLYRGMYGLKGELKGKSRSRTLTKGDGCHIGPISGKILPKNISGSVERLNMNYTHYLQSDDNEF